VKVVGSGHSFSDIADSEGAAQISLARCNRVLDVDQDRAVVMVEAGIRLSDLSRQLAAHGLALSNLGVISSQSLAGAISTGTHGTGLRFGGLAQQVLALRLIAADGEVIEANRERQPDVFDAARIGLGCLGILSTITLQCEPAFNLRLSERPARLDATLDRLASLNAEEHAGLWWFPHTDRVQIRSANRTHEPSTLHRRRLARWLKGVVLGNYVHAMALWLAAFAPSATPTVNRALARTLFGGTHHSTGPSHRIFTSPVLIPQCGLEFGLPVELAATAVRKVRALIDQRGHRVHSPVDIRFSAADDVWLSPAYGRPTCYIGVIAYRPFGRATDTSHLFRELDELLSSLGGRPHWGKIHHWQAPDFAEAYPRWAEFQALRRQLDPKGMFLNAYLRRVLGVEAA
jgi:sugar-1,4-lactone oxidase-like protein